MKIKRILLPFIAAALIAGIGLCGCSQQSTSEQDSSEQEPTTEQEHSYTDHTHQGNTVCSVCGLDYFEEAVDLIKENGEYYPDDTIAYLYQGKTTVSSDTTFLSGVGYSPEDDSISILSYATSSSYTYCASITIPSSSQETSMQEQEYDWFFCDLDGSLMVLGTLDATTYVSYNTTLTPTAYIGVTNSYVLSLVCSLASQLCNIGLANAFAHLLELSDKNLSPSNFGFIYF